MFFFTASNAVQYTDPTTEGRGNRTLDFEYDSTYSGGGYFTLEASPPNIVLNTTFSGFAELKINFVDAGGNTLTTFTLDMAIDADGAFATKEATGFSIEVDSTVEDVIIFNITDTSQTKPYIGIGYSDDADGGARIIRFK